MKILAGVAFILAILIFAPATAEIRTVVTFESASVYWAVGGGSSSKRAHATFRLSGESSSKTSLDLVYDPTRDEYAGSLLNLKPDSTYSLTLHLNGAALQTAQLRTRKETLPIAKTVQVPTGRQTAPLLIKGVSGSPNGYVLYRPASGSLLDGAGVANNIIIDNSSYVIVRGFKLANAKTTAIQLRDGSPVHDIVIEDNEITNWGRITSSGFGDRDDAISTGNGRGTNFARLTVQRNRIYDPRGGSNSWTQFRSDGSGCKKGPPVECHPKGPRAVYVRNSGGGHVVRYNEITAKSGRYFDDAVVAGDAGSDLGSFGPDSDIYGNRISGVWDDGIETEGGNRNVRVWGNYFDQVNNALGLAPILDGPVYVFRNILYRTRHSSNDGYKSGQFVKHAAPDKVAGRVYILHNTVWAGPDDAGGTEIGVRGLCLVNVFARNNILRATQSAYRSDGCAEAKSSDLDYDLYTGPLKSLFGEQSHGIQKEAAYAGSESFALKSGTAGHNDGVVVPNMTAIGQPDRGAQEAGAASMKFGPAAAP